MRPALIALALLLVACDPIQVGTPRGEAPADPSTPAAPTPDPGDAPCESLTRGECLSSVVCTLDAPASRGASRYVCREARGNCEVGLRQLHEDRDRCDDRDGCAWQEGGCYCACRGSGRTAVPDGPEAEDCDCECGGGPPPGCRAR